MDISYFQKINNTYKSKSRQETDLYLLNCHIDEYFADTVDYHVVKRNGKPFELLIIKDTDNNTFKKKIKSRPSEPFNLGDYIEWNDQVWLVTLVDTDDKTYHSGYMYLCTVPLRWQNSEGKIIERYVYAEDFTKYSNGITGNATVTIRDNQYGLTLPVDSETKKLKCDMRFPMDFDDSEQPDIYKLTNRKVKLNDNQYFGRGSTMILTMSFDAFNPNDDKKVIMEDGKEVWICNYNDPSSPLPPTPSEPDETTDSKTPDHNQKINLSIKYDGKKYIFAGGEEKIFYAIVTDEKNNIINDIKVNWNITVLPKNEKYIYYKIYDNSINIKADYHNSIIGEKVLLSASVNDINDSIYVEIGGGI